MCSWKISLFIWRILKCVFCLICFMFSMFYHKTHRGHLRMKCTTHDWHMVDLIITFPPLHHKVVPDSSCGIELIIPDILSSAWTPVTLKQISVVALNHNGSKWWIIVRWGHILLTKISDFDSPFRCFNFLQWCYDPWSYKHFSVLCSPWITLFYPSVCVKNENRLPWFICGMFKGMSRYKKPLEIMFPRPQIAEIIKQTAFVGPASVTSSIAGHFLCPVLCFYLLFVPAAQL